MRHPGPVWLVLTLVLLPVVLVFAALGSEWFTAGGRHAIVAVVTDQPALIMNTILYGGLTAVLTTLLGWTIAHVQHIYATPASTVLHGLALAPLLMPSFTFAMALVIVLGHNGLAVRALSLPGGVVYGFVGLVAAGTLSRLPIAYLALRTSYRHIDTRMLEAATELGASGPRMFNSILLPRLSRTLVATCLVIMADTVADLAVPLVLAGSVGTLSARVVEAASSEANPTMAAAYAAWLLPMTLLLLPLAHRLNPRPGAEGAIHRRLMRPLNPTGTIMLVISWLTVGVVALMLVAVAAASVVNAIGIDNRITLAHFGDVVTGSQTRALATTVLTALVSVALVLAAASGMAAFAALNGSRGVRHVVEGAAAVPGIVWGLGIFVLLESTWLFRGETTTWAGSGIPTALGVVIFVHVVRFVPQVSQTLMRTSQDFTPRVRDAALVLATTRRTVARALLVPAIRQEWWEAGLVVFARTLTAVSSVVLLSNARAPLLSVRMLTDVEAGRLSSAAAMNVTLAVLIAATAFTARLLGARPMAAR